MSKTRLAALALCVAMCAALAPMGAEAAEFTVLYRFTGGADGGKPSWGLVRDKEGNLYGTTNIGGLAGGGTIFKLDPHGHESVLYHFGTFGFLNTGAEPSGLIQDEAGDLYFTTAFESAYPSGTVSKVDLKGNRSVLYAFTGGSDGAQPMAGVVKDGAGNLYGTANKNNGNGSGVVFKLEPNGTESVLHYFGIGTQNDGAYPVAGVTLDKAGSVYGTTPDGGAYVPDGTVFKVNTKGVERVLYRFGFLPDGQIPNGGLIREAAGNLYGTTTYGGAGGGIGGYGTVFKIDTKGKKSTLYSFKGIPDGVFPYSTLSMDKEGNLYGTTFYGGKYGLGAVFKLEPCGRETVLHSFTGGRDGQYPYQGSLILDENGYLYGTVIEGGIANGSNGFGTVFRIKL
jgi:uncharacterized repeat protein (TIGR03803 family)